MNPLLDSLLGHKKVLQSLFRVADKGALPPVLLFAGAPGIGKKQVALLLTQYLVCEGGDQGQTKPCGQCGPCVRVAKGHSESLLLIQPQGAQIKIDQAHEVLRFCQLSNPARARVVIFDQVERLNTQAANALLKIFEEPPRSTHFILLAPSLLSVMSTIRSRAQVVKMSPIPIAELRKKVDAPDWILESSEGRFDRVEALQNEDVLEHRQNALRVLRLTLHNAGNVSRAPLVEALKDQGLTRDQAQWWVRFWREFWRDSWFQKENLKPLLHPDLAGGLQPLAAQPAEFLQLGSQLVESLDRDLRGNGDVQISMEAFLRQLAREAGTYDIHVD